MINTNTQPNILRIATRKSPLALWQANYVSQLCQNIGFQTQIIPIESLGDKILNKPLYDIGGKGLFIKELEKASKIKLTGHNHSIPCLNHCSERITP